MIKRYVNSLQKQITNGTLLQFRFLQSLINNDAFQGLFEKEDFRKIMNSTKLITLIKVVLTREIVKGSYGTVFTEVCKPTTELRIARLSKARTKAFQNPNRQLQIARILWITRSQNASRWPILASLDLWRSNRGLFYHFLDPSRLSNRASYLPLLDLLVVESPILKNIAKLFQSNFK